VSKARWWRELSDGRIECDLCPRRCRLAEDQRGFCFVRRNVGGKMELTTYGRSSGFCIDPIEKKPLNHFLPGTGVLSFGTAGCNLGCRFCQNWNISKSREMDRLADIASPERIAAAALEHGCRSVAFTYNDPVIFAEYALDIAAACTAVGVRSVAVSAGYITATARPGFFAGMDAANIDLKAFSESFYQATCSGHLQPVLETLRHLKHETDVWLEVTTLLIPGANDTEPELHEAAEWFAENLGADVPWHFTAFHPDFKMLEKPRTPAATLARARDIARSKGLHHVYTGNVHDRERGSTWCPECGELLVERNWYELGVYRLNGNRCHNCDTTIPGVFEPAPGTRGRQRRTLRMD
jgi:pyruvate formate lyase activating enzyme